jgi:hypothetical protein
MAEVQSCEVSLAQQWIGFPWLCHIPSLTDVTMVTQQCYQSQHMYFSVGQKRHKGSDVNMEIRASSLL